MHIKLSATASALVLVSGCSSLPEAIEGRFEKTDLKASALVKEVGHTTKDSSVKAGPSISHESGIWIGKKVVKMGDPALPPIFYEQATFDRTVHSLSELAERLTLRSGIPIKVSPEALGVAAAAPRAAGTAGATGAAGASPVPPPSAAALPAANLGGSDANNGPVRISYTNGTFKGLLDTVSARYGVSWKYANGAIQFFHTESRTFQISAIPGDSSLTANVTSGAVSAGGTTGGTTGGNSGVSANNTQNIGVSSRLAVYSSIEESIKAMISARGKVVSSPATGTITVVDTPDTLDRIATFVENENKALARQVVINVTVLSVTLANADEYGINWNLVYNGLREKYGITNTVAAGSPNSTAFSAGILGTSRFAGSELIIRALSEQGKVQRQTTASVVTLNNQPVPVQVAKQKSYLASSQTTITAEAVTTTLTPGLVTAGFNMSILPHVLANGTVMLQFSTDISALRDLRTVESGGSRIETPELDTRNFLQRVAMKSNETLIISGFEQTDDTLGHSGVGNAKNPIFGGGYKAAANKEVIVILITPTTTVGS